MYEDLICGIADVPLYRKITLAYFAAEGRAMPQWSYAMQYGIKHHIDVSVRAAGAVVFNSNNQVLLVQELEGSEKGLWHIPSGSVEANELPQEAAIKNVVTGLTEFWVV